MDASPRAGAINREHRDRVRDILATTGLFRDEEIDVALELFDETFPAGADRIATREATSPDGSYRFLGAFATPPEKFGATKEALAGYVCWGPTPGTDRTWDLYWIAVDPAMQGSGTGTMLMREVEQRVKQDAARMLVVETSSRDDYAPTRKFYVGRGYEEAARVGSFYAPGDDRVIYVKRFPEAREGGVVA